MKSRQPRTASTATTRDPLELQDGETLKVLAFAKPFHLKDPDGPNSFALIGFRDRDGVARRTVVPASHLVTKPDLMINHLADRGFRWPDSQTARAQIRDLAAADVPERAIITFVPGWHGDAYARPEQWFAPDNAKGPVAEFTRSPSVKLGPFLKAGSLARWRDEVATVAHHSSLARLFIALPFAATVLRLLRAKSFGVAVVGDSSVGKTLLLRLGASVMGDNGEEGLPTLKASLTAIEELVLGHRDGFVPLDEVGLIEGDPKVVAAVLKALSFQVVTGQRRNRASHYEDAVGAIKPDTRVVFGLTTETSLAALARRAEQQRLRGEEVRLIEIPAVAEGAIDIFDRPKADQGIGRTAAERQREVHAIERACDENQGVAHCVFLRELCNDPDAVTDMHGWAGEFSEAARHLHADASRGRMISSFAVTYAAARLAIEYEILPWGPKATLAALLRCATNALAHLSTVERGTSEGKAAGPSDDEVLADFTEKLRASKLVELTGQSASRDEIMAADAFRVGAEDEQAVEAVLLEAERLRDWFPVPQSRIRLVEVLKRRSILLPGRDRSTNTIQKQIAPLGQRRPYYALAAAGLVD